MHYRTSKRIEKERKPDRAVVRLWATLSGIALFILIALSASIPSLAQAQSVYYRVTNDYFLAEQWSLFNFGQTIGGKPGGNLDVDVRAPEAWGVTMGDPSVVVAVIDTGIAMDHPDLKANIWTNPGETGNGRETNGIDDDNNGYVDDWHGWDFVDKDNDPTDQREKSVIDESADIFHGTAVASIIGAEADNRIGMAGVAPKTRLMALRVIGGGVQDKDIADAVRYAKANGAKIVNLSLATFIPGFGYPQTAEAIRQSPEVLFVAGAGNAGTNADVTKPEPCAIEVPHLICAAATDPADALAKFARQSSNYGKSSVDLAAPGGSMLVAQPAPKAIFEEAYETALAGRWQSAGTGVEVTTTASAGRSGNGLLLTSQSAAADGSIRGAQPVDLSGQRGCWLDFWAKSDLSNPAVATLETSTDGRTFARRPGARGFAITGVSADFERFYVPLDFADNRQVWLGFNLTRGAGTVQIDDLRVTCNSNDFNDRSYAYAEGTSFATPMVAGAAALVMAKYPNFNPAQVKNAILLGSRPVAELNDKIGTGGRLDLYGALLEAGKVAGAAPAQGAPERPPAGLLRNAAAPIGELLTELRLPTSQGQLPPCRGCAMLTANRGTQSNGLLQLAAQQMTPPVYLGLAVLAAAFFVFCGVWFIRRSSTVEAASTGATWRDRTQPPRRGASAWATVSLDRARNRPDIDEPAVNVRLVPDTGRQAIEMDRDRTVIVRATLGPPALIDLQEEA